MAQQDDSEPNLKIHYGDKVKLKNGNKGTVKFIGEVVGKKGVFYGIDLAKGNGKNTGSFQKETYFKTKDGKKSGIFCRETKIKSTKTTQSSIKFTVGDRVSVKGKGNGMIRFVGVPPFSKKGSPMYDRVHLRFA